MARTVPFQTVIDALLDDQTPFPARYLHRFSDITPPDLAILQKTWGKVSQQRKHTLLEDLENLAETDSLTNFGDMARTLLGDADSQVRISAIRLLWEDEDFRLASIFLNMMEKDEEIAVRAAAANALGLFVYQGEMEKISAQLHHRIEDELLRTATVAKDALLRRRALESLGYSGREEVIPLIETAFHSKDPDWVASALFAMGRSCDERWKKQILSKLREPDDEIRSQAIHAAGELELTSSRSILMDILEDEEDLEIRRELIWALSKIGGKGVRDRLEEILEAEEDDDEASFIEEALENLTFTDDMAGFDLFGLDPEAELHEEDDDEDYERDAE
jgi:HEAT repeat protein